jgi:hypothetical protein
MSKKYNATRLEVLTQTGWKTLNAHWAEGIALPEGTFPMIVGETVVSTNTTTGLQQQQVKTWGEHSFAYPDLTYWEGLGVRVHEIDGRPMTLCRIAVDADWDKCNQALLEAFGV